jgi:4-amino-4-deoxy-L-arabinose transferase-like glycosyltransferase
MGDFKSSTKIQHIHEAFVSSLLQKNSLWLNTCNFNTKYIKLLRLGIQPILVILFTFALMNRNIFLFPVLLVLLWILIILIVNPIGNFPLNDDWQYARPVWYLINKGFYYSPDNYSPILITQVYWGALFCLFGGFSFTTLRISILVLGIIGVIVFYFLLRRITKNNLLSFLGAVILLINPFYVCQGFTFMTDTSFIALAIISVYFYYISLESNKKLYVLIGTLFSIASMLIRQFCIVIPFGYAVAAILKNKPKINQWYKYFIPAIITTLTLKLALFWLKYIGSELHPYGGHHVSDYLHQPGSIVLQTFQRVGYILFYTGFFLFPFLIARARFFYKSLSTKERKYVIIFSILSIPSLICVWAKLPYGYVISEWSMGATPIRMGDFPIVQHSAIILNLIVTVAFIGGLLLSICFGSILVNLFYQYRSGKFDNKSVSQSFIIASMLGYFILLVIPDVLFDRYLLFYIPMFFILISIGWHDFKLVKLPTIALHSILFIVVIIFSSFCTHDYLAWNRARWQASDYLTKDLKISPHKIDGGFEFNGWYIGKYFPLDRGKSWWYVDDDEYIVSFGNIDGYTIMKQYPYQNYFPYEIRNMYILHRK